MIIYVIRAFGGTLILTIVPPIPPPPMHITWETDDMVAQWVTDDMTITWRTED